MTYDRFVKWAIGLGLWPATIKPQDLLDWALDEKRRSNLHWRKDYGRLETAWSALVADGKLPTLSALRLPAKLTQKYALPLDQWPVNLRDEWQRMCSKAAAPLRKGGMRPWRSITQNQYQQRLTLLLGWFSQEHPAIKLAEASWNRCCQRSTARSTSIGLSSALGKAT